MSGRGSETYRRIQQENISRIQAVLTHEWQTARQIAARAKLSNPMTTDILGKMVDARGSALEFKLERVDEKSDQRRYIYRLKIENRQPA